VIKPVARRGPVHDEGITVTGRMDVVVLLSIPRCGTDSLGEGSNEEKRHTPAAFVIEQRAELWKFSAALNTHVLSLAQARAGHLSRHAARIRDDAGRNRQP
jgi:hypothetical protein